MGLVSELKRRNVFRMMALYIVAAWLIMQVAEVVIGLANLPDWVGPSILALLLTGLPIALLLSWFYELTPEGISLDTKEDGRGPSIAGRRIDFIVISLLCAALLLFAFDKWAGERPSELSIAVLPFKTIGTEDAERSGFLAQGIQDDLLTRLSTISAMKVISRTSVERYRNTTKSIPLIAAELGVRKILEGGVQSFGDDVRVNVQLIDAESDEHIWAATYDRALTASNIFSIQSEIVEAVAHQTHTSLTPSESRQLVSPPTTNLAAYTAYLRGREKANIESVASLNEAVEFFQQAIDLDPNFSLAYIRLADAYLTLGANFFGGLSVAESNALAEPPIARALMLNENLGEAHATLGLLRQQQGDIASAEIAYQEAIALRPNYARAFHLYGRLKWRNGDKEQGIALLRKALEIDPYSAPVNYDVGRAYDEAGEFEEAMARYLRIIEIEPDHAFAYVYIAAMHYLVYGRADVALVWYDKAARNDAMSPSLQAAPALAYLELGEPESAKLWVDKSRELGPDTFWSIWASLLHSLYIGDDVAVQSNARTMLEHYPGNWGALNVLCNADIKAGRYDVARARYSRSFPELVGPELPQVDTSNYGAAVDLARVYLLLGEETRADDLLRGSLNVIQTIPRLGIAGHYVTDVRIYAIQNRRDKALTALRQAVDEGWRFMTWYYLEQDPSLDSIRGTPEFDRISAELRKDLHRQLERVRDLKASGELVSYLEQADSRPLAPGHRPAL